MKKFSLTINLHDFFVESFIGAEGYLLARDDHGCIISFQYIGRFFSHTFINKLDSGLELRTYNGGIIPLYYRKSNGNICISNYPAELLQHGETAVIKTQAILQKMTGSSAQMNNVFSDISQFEESSIYRIVNAEICYVDSVFSQLVAPDKSMFSKVLRERFEKYSSANAVLLSGGYDSRLNLALAMKYSKNSSITAFHEYKDEKEFLIAQTVAETCNIPLTIRSRDAYKAYAIELSQDANFVFHYGLNRDNIRRWTGYMQDIISCAPGNQIIGMGAEPHKGKYYEYISDYDKDLMDLFSLSKSSEVALANEFNAPSYHNFQYSQLSQYVSESKRIFKSKESGIDFVHYHTYIVNGYGARNQYFFSEFDIDYPMFDTELLNHVFSLEREHKEGFLLVRELLSELNPDMQIIPFVSGNQKSISSKPTLSTRIFNKLFKMGKARPDKLRMDIGLTSRGAKTELTCKLKKMLDSNSIYVSRKDVYMLYNYFTLLEEVKAVDFKLI